MLLPTDLHIHSKYARAVSPQMTLENIDTWSRIKGLGIVGTGDFTHPLWIKDIAEKLEPAKPGLFHLKSKYVKKDFHVAHSIQPYFLLTTEISCIYSKNGKVRKVHCLLFAPTIEIVSKINEKLSRVGKLGSDGRPILGLDAKELLKIALDVSPECVLIPAHVWTPWFGVFGSKSGFDTLEECFDELTSSIYAVETGLSSDPAMNWRMKFLDKKTIVSFSDPHSLPRLAREATVFDIEPDYQAFRKALQAGDKKHIPYTIEFFPEEGRYHFDGHSACGVSLSPAETKKAGFLCPLCHKPLTIGVLNRIEELADRPEGYDLGNRIPFKSLVALDEIIADSLEVGKASKKVTTVYHDMIAKLGNELYILLDASVEEIARLGFEKIAEGIRKVRSGKVSIKPGYDGEYGEVSIFEKTKLQKPKKEFQKVVKKKIKAQRSLF